jgi:hypothetical protein
MNLRSIATHRLTLWVVLFVAMIFVLWASAVSAQEDPRLAASRALAAEFGLRLKAALTDALAQGGPVAAIAVCKDTAPQIASELSRRSGTKVGRTSSRLRNPLNAAESWSAGALADFAAALDAGADPAALEYFARADDATRYLRPIFTDGLCLVCHGAALSPQVAAELATHYPHDLATGYEAGDLRGAFVVVWPQIDRP